MSVFEQHESEVRAYSRAMPAVFDTARGARQFDEDGNAYLDFFAGAGVLNFGHNDERMTEALIAYLQRGGVAHSLDMNTTAKRTFIQRFVDVILEPRGLDYKLQFTGPTGTNAVEAALKLARRVTGRRTVVAFTNGFHGMTLGALAATGNCYHRAAAGVPLEHVHRAAFDGYLGGSVDTLEALRRMLGDASGGLEPPAAFLVETVQAEGGVNIARAEWLQALQALAREHESLLIVDDIQVGCGRTGTYFSFEDHGIDPDIVVLAKGIGGFGLPLAMLLSKPEHDARWRPGEHTGTFRGQDLAFVAGTVALDYFADETLLADVRRKGAVIGEHLEALAGTCDAAVRRRGMIAGLDMGSGALAGGIAKDAFERRLILSPCGPEGRVLKVIPPLTIPDDDLREGLDLLAQSVASALASA